MTLLAWLINVITARRAPPASIPAPKARMPAAGPSTPVAAISIDETPADSVETDKSDLDTKESSMTNTPYSPAFLSAVNYVLDHERGYVNNPKDPGGPTNMGITWKTLARWRGVHRNQITPDDVKNLTRDEAIAIYDAMYWDAIRADKLPPALAYAAFDFAVNSGPVRAVKEIQKLIGTTADGLIGGHTMRCIGLVKDKVKLVNDYADARLAFMKRARHPKTKALLWPTFKNGWSKRVADVRTRSLRHIETGGGGSW